MNRRTFLKLTGVAVAARTVPNALLVGGPDTTLPPAQPAAANLAGSGPSDTSLAIIEPGLYRVSGLVRLEAPLVEISGLGHNQSISWSGSDGAELPVASFMTFERFDEPGIRPNVRVQGGQLVALAAVPLD